MRECWIVVKKTSLVLDFWLFFCAVECFGSWLLTDSTGFASRLSVISPSPLCKLAIFLHPSTDLFIFLLSFCSLDSLPLCHTFAKTRLVSPRPICWITGNPHVIVLVCSVTGLLLLETLPVSKSEQGKDFTSRTSLTRSSLQTGSVWFGRLRSISVQCPLRPLCTHVDLNQLHPTARWAHTHVRPLEGANVLNVNTSICVYLHRYLINFLE